MTEQTIAEYVRERDAALSVLDMAYAEKLMPNATDHVRLMAMHKARYECVHIAPELRRESREWLESQGYRRLGGLPWPDVLGKLPE